MKRIIPTRDRSGFAMIVVMGFLAVLFLVFFAIIGGQTVTGRQTLSLQARAAARSEAKSGMIRALRRWRADGEPRRLSAFFPPQNKTLSPDAVMAPENSDAPRGETQVKLWKGEERPELYERHGIEPETEDLWISVRTPFSGATTAHSLWLLPGGNMSRRTLVSEEALISAP